jgi:hypothetical protein
MSSYFLIFGFFGFFLFFKERKKGTAAFSGYGTSNSELLTSVCFAVSLSIVQITRPENKSIGKSSAHLEAKCVARISPICWLVLCLECFFVTYTCTSHVSPPLQISLPRTAYSLPIHNCKIIIGFHDDMLRLT